MSKTPKAKTPLINHVVKCDTVGDLLDALAAIAADPALQSVLDASIESATDVFSGFRITETVLSDRSTVLNFEFTEYEL